MPLSKSTIQDAVPGVNRKLRVGFGPETTANSFTQSGLKVSRELERDSRFECGIFKEPFSYEELCRFDVIVFIKICPDYELLKRLKDRGRRLILDYHDMFLYPSLYERGSVKRILKRMYYRRFESKEKKRYGLFDRCLVASPVAEKVVREAGMEPFFLARQIFNDWNRTNPKVHSDKTRGLNILWTGVGLNIHENEPVMKVLEGLCRKYASKVLYLTDADGSGPEFIEYRRWSIKTWEREMLEGDIAFRWWKDSNTQYQKDSNKVISYMASGLPVVCRPTVSDRLVIKDGTTGVFASDPGAFEASVERLILDPLLRKKIGMEAHGYVWSNYSIECHVEKLKGLILTLA